MKQHPVQPTPASWKPPARYKTCDVGETIYGIPIEVGGPMLTVTILDCPDGIKVVDHYTKKEVDWR